MTGELYFVGGLCATCGKPVPGGGHADGCTGLVPGTEYRLDGGQFHRADTNRIGGSGGSMSVNPDLIEEWKRMDEEGGQQ